MAVLDISIILWIAIAVVLVIVEGATTMLVSIWTAFGAVAAAIAAALGADLFIQILVFAVVSAALLVFTRPLAKKLLKKDAQPTNADSLIGKEAFVTEDILPPEYLGRVKVGGKSWAARSVGNSEILKGETVIIEQIEGVKLIVTPND